MVVGGGGWVRPWGRGEGVAKIRNFFIFLFSFAFFSLLTFFLRKVRSNVER